MFFFLFYIISNSFGGPLNFTYWILFKKPVVYYKSCERDRTVNNQNQPSNASSQIVSKHAIEWYVPLFTCFALLLLLLSLNTLCGGNIVHTSERPQIRLEPVGRPELDYSLNMLLACSEEQQRRGRHHQHRHIAQQIQYTDQLLVVGGGGANSTPMRNSPRMSIARTPRVNTIGNQSARCEDNSIAIRHQQEL